MNECGLLRGIQDQLSVGCQARPYSQPFARSAVDFIGDGIQLLLALARQVGDFGEVLAHHANQVGLLMPFTGRTALTEKMVPVLLGIGSSVDV